MTKEWDRRTFLIAGTAIGPGAMLASPPAKRRVYATQVIGCAITPTSDFAELPDDVLRDMIAAMYVLEDQPDLVDDALGWAAGRLKAAFEAGTRRGYHFQRDADARPAPVIFDAMIDAYEPNLIRAQCTEAGIVNFYAEHRAGLCRAVQAAARRGYHYRANGALAA